MAMNPERKQLWLDALRSGRYQQGRGLLKSTEFGGQDPSYCCLGVACEVYRQETGDGFWQDYALEQPAFVPPQGEHWARWSSLPTPVAEWYGLDNEDPTVRIVGDGGGIESDSLANINDFGGTFEEIAALIEEQF